MSQDQEGAAGFEGVVLASSLVTYQPGAVVSRTLVRKPAGTVTAFAFDAGEGLSEHTAPFDALVLSLEGEADFSVSGTSSRAFREEVAGVSGSGLGSCLIVLATDAPLSKRNLERLSQQPLASTADMCWRELT